MNALFSNICYGLSTNLALRAAAAAPHTITTHSHPVFEIQKSVFVECPHSVPRAAYSYASYQQTCVKQLII
jgi:hypothetical protein